MSYSSVLRRFWWVLLIGVVVTAVAGFVVLRTSSEDPTYSATSQLLVTSAEGPYFRISVERASEVPEAGGGDETRELVQTVPPDILTLVRAANLYPLLITSDPVRELREDRFGQLPGELTARAVFAVETPSRFQPSDVPVIELTATSSTPREAIELATATSKSFISWLGQEQDSAGLGKSERINVRELTTPTDAIESGGSNLSLPILVMALVLMGFAALAVLLDRIVPSDRLRLRPRPAVAAAGTLEVHPGTSASEGNGAVGKPDEQLATARRPSRPRRGSGRRRSKPPAERTAAEPADAEQDASEHADLQRAASAKRTSGGAGAKPGRIA